MAELEMICSELPSRVEKVLPGGWSRAPFTLRDAEVEGKGNCLAHAQAARKIVSQLLSTDAPALNLWIAEKLAFGLDHSARRLLNHTGLVVTSAVQKSEGILYHHRGAAMGAEAIPIECDTKTITEFMGQAGTQIVPVALDFTPAGLAWDELRDHYEFDHFEAV